MARPKLPSWILPESTQEGKQLTGVPSYDVSEHNADQHGTITLWVQERLSNWIYREIIPGTGNLVSPWGW